MTGEGLLADYARPEELAADLGVSVRTLTDWRGKGEGPPHVKIGRQVFYPRIGFKDWVAARVRDGAV
jgi:hypothetical protein